VPFAALVRRYRFFADGDSARWDKVAERARKGRLLAVPWVVRLAHRRARGRCCAAIATLVVIDLADGILARRIGDLTALRRQRALNSVADVAPRLTAPLCARRLCPTLLRQEAVPIANFAAAQAARPIVCYA
jgi:hypothetical protein